MSRIYELQSLTLLTFRLRSGSGSLLMKYTGRKHGWGVLGASENLVMKECQKTSGIEKEN